MVASQTDALAVLHRQRRKTNHVLHLLLTVFTCGLWAPIWIILAIVKPGWDRDDDIATTPPPPAGDIPAYG